jgi:hypothetical protein
MSFSKLFQKTGLLLLTSILSLSFISCEQTESEALESDIVAADMHGSWYVEFLSEGEDIYSLGYQLINTYNTSENDGSSMWINDNEHTWTFNVNCPINASSKTFSGEALYSNVDDYEVDVTITNGKITEGGTTSLGGYSADQISFDAEFSDDAGTVFQVIGYRHVGYIEDVP